MMSSAEKKKKFSRRMSEVINAHPTPNADPGSFLYNAIAIDFTTFKWIGNQYHYRPCNTGLLRLKCKTMLLRTHLQTFKCSHRLKPIRMIPLISPLTVARHLPNIPCVSGWKTTNSLWYPFRSRFRHLQAGCLSCSLRN